jgi:maltose alpha-D-glucosyltransferase/alpha-amylase
MMNDDPLWYKDAVFYELHVRAFRDGNDDGIGDFAGLTSQLRYLKELGVDCLWLLPFFKSPLRDDGYDVADYQAIHPDYGTMADFDRFLEAAHGYGLRVISDFVMNHTSDQHPWFQAARRQPDSPFRDYYVWSDTDQKYRDARIIFLDSEASNWTWDPVAKAYYWHRFFHHQPDLNFESPAVRRDLLEMMRFWLDKGFDGFRCDAVPYLFERESTNCENLPETHEFLREVRRHVDAHYQGRILLAEANQWPPDVRPYFGDGDEFHMAFHFPLMPRIFLAVRHGDRRPITDIFLHTPEIPPACQWCLFLRNHDELTLEMVSEEERRHLYHGYGSDPRMRLNLGIRRRLAPLLDNDRRKIELLTSLLFTLPGSPILYYGDEIGMGDNIYLGDRNGVRTPMQWTGDRNAGFSRADTARLYLPMIVDPGVRLPGDQCRSPAPHAVVAPQLDEAPHRGAEEDARLRARDPALPAAGQRERARPRARARGRERARRPQPVRGRPAGRSWICRPGSGTRRSRCSARAAFPPIGNRPYFISLAPYGYYWFRLQPPPGGQPLYGLENVL